MFEYWILNTKNEVFRFHPREQSSTFFIFYVTGFAILRKGIQMKYITEPREKNYEVYGKQGSENLVDITLQTHWINARL